MEAAEIEVLVDELEQRVDRLRALYEQYFMGIEKIEPMVQRKDVDRRVYVLRRVQIRNTALRFRFNNTIQRLNTMQQYWMRIVREIENGTYKRDVRRAAARFGADAIEGARKKGLGKLLEQVEADRGHDHEFDVDVEMDELSDEAAAEHQAPRHAEAATRRSPLHAGFGELVDDEFHSPDFGDGEGFGAADVGFGSLPEFEEAPRPGRVPIVNPALSSFFEPEEYDAAEWGEAPKKASRPTTPAPAPPAPSLVAPATDPAPPPSAPPDNRPVAARSSSGLLSSLGGARRPPLRSSSSEPAAGSSAPPVAAHPSPSPAAGLLGSRPRSPVAPHTQSQAISSSPASPRPPDSPVAPKPAPARSPIAPSPAPPARPSVPSSGAPAARAPVASTGAPAARAAVTSGGGAAARPVAASPAPARPSPQQPTAQRAAAAPPAGNGAEGHGLTNERVRKIYESYVQARRACRESTSNITEGKLDEMLKQSAAKLRGKHGAKNIDFDVVIKDGKAVLKPVVKG